MSRKIVNRGTIGETRIARIKTKRWIMFANLMTADLLLSEAKPKHPTISGSQ